MRNPTLTVLRMMCAGLIACSSGQTAAQDKPVQGPSFLGVPFAPPTCERTDRTTLACSVVGTYPGKDPNSVLTIFPAKARIFAADGTAFVASAFSGGGAGKVAAQANVSFPRGIPVKLTFVFTGVPTTLTLLRGLAFETVNYENIRILDRTQPSPPVTTTALITLPTRTSAPGKFSITLSACVAAGTSYTCTANLSPAR